MTEEFANLLKEAKTKAEEIPHMKEIKLEQLSEADLAKEQRINRRRQWVNQEETLDFIKQLREKRDKFLIDAENLSAQFPLDVAQIAYKLNQAYATREIIDKQLLKVEGIKL